MNHQFESNTNYGDYNNNFEIANLDTKAKAAIDKAENLIKSETGKDYIVIAWEKK